MGIKMLIERLNELYRSLRLDGEQQCSPEINTVAFGLMDAATALSTLQAENEKLWAELECTRESLDFARTKDAEIVRLGTELEQVKRERDAAVKDLEKLCRDDVGPCEMAICELCAYNNGAQCSRNDGQICDGYDVFNWKWRGPQKED